MYCWHCHRLTLHFQVLQKICLLRSLFRCSHIQPLSHRCFIYSPWFTWMLSDILSVTYRFMTIHTDAIICSFCFPKKMSHMFTLSHMKAVTFIHHDSCKKLSHTTTMIHAESCHICSPWFTHYLSHAIVIYLYLYENCHFYANLHESHLHFFNPFYIEAVTYYIYPGSQRYCNICLWST